jgi:putative sterol carrier protein
MTGSTEMIFARLGLEERQQLLSKVCGTARFTLVDGPDTDYWLLRVDHGQVSISQEDADADCSVRMERAFFERLVGGHENTVAAILRGAITCSGDMALLLSIQRIFPGPPRHYPANDLRDR